MMLALRPVGRTTHSIIKTVLITTTTVNTTIKTVNITGKTVLTTWIPKTASITTKATALAMKYRIVRALATYTTTTATEWATKDEPHRVRRLPYHYGGVAQARHYGTDLCHLTALLWITRLWS